MNYQIGKKKLNIIYDYKNNKFCKKINKIFLYSKYTGVFSAIEKKDKIYKCYRDPIGIKKIFYGISKNKKKNVLFSNNFTELLGSCKKTTIKSIKPGSCQEIDERGKIINTTIIEKEKYKNFKKLDLEIRKRLLEFFSYVKKNYKSNTCVVCLSGGLDSTIIAYYSKKIFKNVITITAYCAENKKNFDLNAAKKIADYLQLKNIQIPLLKSDIKENLKNILQSCQDWRDYNVHCAALNFILAKYLAKRKLFFPVFTGDFMNEIFADYKSEKVNEKVIYNVPQINFFYKRRFFMSALESSNRENGVFNFHKIDVYQPYSIIKDLYDCVPSKIFKKSKSKYDINGKLIPKKLLKLVLKTKNRAQVGDGSGGIIKYFLDLGFDQKNLEKFFDKNFKTNKKFRESFISLGKYRN